MNISKYINKEMFDMALIPAGYRNVDPKRFPEDVKPKIAKYCKHIETMFEKGWGFYLWGEHSHGKTAISCYLLYSCLISGRSGLFMPYSDITPAFIEKTSLSPDLRLSDKILDCGMLVIDDWLPKNGTSYADGLFERVIRERVHWKRPTILTTQISPANVGENSDAVGALVKQSLLPIKIESVDFRKEEADERKEFFKGGADESA